MATTRADGTLVEGFVDLVYREADGPLVVVDYNTDAVPAAALTARAAYYRPQLQAYVDMLAAATGVADIRGVLLFLHPERGAVGVEVPVAPASKPDPAHAYDTDP